MYDYGKGIFNKDYFEDMDEEEKARIGNLQLVDGQLVDTRMLDFDPNAKISDRSFTLNDPTAITKNNITGTNYPGANPYELSNDLMDLEQGVEPGFSPLQAKDGGRIQYMNGGLTDLVDIYD